MANEKMDLIKHMALLRNIANDVTEIMSSTGAADFINAAIEIINDYPSDGKLVDTGKSNCTIFDVVRSLRFDKPTETGWQFDPDLLRSITKAAMKHDPLISMEHVEYVLRAIADKQ